LAGQVAKQASRSYIPTWLEGQRIFQASRACRPAGLAVNQALMPAVLQASRYGRPAGHTGEQIRQATRPAGLTGMQGMHSSRSGRPAGVAQILGRKACSYVWPAYLAGQKGGKAISAGRRGLSGQQVRKAGRASRPTVLLSQQSCLDGRSSRTAGLAGR
jgi:hypothetical protein